MDIFEASVQYNDFKGSAAADRADMTGPTNWLKENGFITDELVVGISMYAGENHGVHEDPVSVKFLILDLDGYDNVPDMLEDKSEPVEVQEINIDMNIEDFLALFKRLEITLSSSGMIEGKSYISV